MVLWILIGVIMLLSCGMIGIGLYFYHRAIYAHSKKDFILVDPHKRVTKEDQWYLQSRYQNVAITSFDGLALRGSVIANEGKKWILLVHGYMGRKEDMIPQAKAFYERGFDVALIDLRGHGKSEGDVIGFGYLDHKDVLLWVDFLKQTFHADHIVLYGVSMGAASVMLCADQVDDRVACIIEDCGFSNLKDQLHYIVKHMVPHIPSSFLIFCLSLVMKAKAGYKIAEVDCIPHVKEAKVPMMFLHGERDGFIEINMMYAVYEACSSMKSKASLPKGRHANSHKFDSERYWNQIDQFLKKVELI